MKLSKILLPLLLLFNFTAGNLMAQNDPPAPLNGGNATSSISFDLSGRPIGQSLSFYNDLGKITQSQSWDVTTGYIWANETLYDYFGRPVFQTMSAPIGSQFGLQNNFLTNQYGGQYSTGYFDLGTTIDNPGEPGKTSYLGKYYSNANDLLAYQDITDHPFQRLIYSRLNPGTPLRVLGGKKLDINADNNLKWTNPYQFSMKGGTELTASNAFSDPLYSNKKITKTVYRDIHGVESVIFTDSDGNTLAAARSGNENGPRLKHQNVVQMSEQGFLDIHIPVGCAGVTITGNSGYTLHIYDLITEERVYTSASSLPPGFYRIAIAKVDQFLDRSGFTNISIQHEVNYYDYSLNYYDKANRLTSSKPPLTGLASSTFKYNSLGQLLETSSPDEGTAKFKYRRDGQIRFSQNSVQQQEGKFSYTNYDNKARPVESGVVTNLDFNSTDPDAPLPETAVTAEVHQVLYDTPFDWTSLASQSCIDLSNTYKQQFVSGNVSMTTTKNPATSTTVYSYDVQGRVTWVLQFIEGLSCAKTIDYTYDSITGQVTKVDYQRNTSQERFIHNYSYDISGRLVQVETSLNDIDYKLQAKYLYSISGELVRTEIADGLQGIDYVYNLNGQLKAINHPSLEPEKDPGKDGITAGTIPDLFGMALDYNNQDYLRDNTPTPVATFTGGQNQFNGNIKAMRWKGESDQGAQNIYNYDYNKNNWLQQAEYGRYIEGVENAPVDLIVDTPIANTSTEEYTATGSITFNPGFYAPYGSTMTAEIVENQGYTPDENGDYKVENLLYDANGNILSLRRNKNSEGTSNAMDDLNYSYYGGKNQLQRVEDAVIAETNANDIKGQSGNNYVYNSIGQLIYNTQEDLTYTYNASGLVSSISKPGMQMELYYNDRGHRIKKVTTMGGTVSTSHYVRDVSGNVMAVYEGVSGTVSLEYSLYGASRIGVMKKGLTATTVSNQNYFYELKDHLGNVRAVVQKDNNGNAIALTKTDYYPFGMAMPGRNIEGDYKYGYQGEFSEKDQETGLQAFELRMYDSRIGRWISPDPYGEFYSPYMAMGNSPISIVDPDGGCTNKRGEECIKSVLSGVSTDFAGNEWSHNGREWLGMETAQQMPGVFIGTREQWVNTYVTPLREASANRANEIWMDNWRRGTAEMRMGAVELINVFLLPLDAVELGAARILAPKINHFDNIVYLSRNSDGVVDYVGITNNLARRAGEHLASKGIRIEGLKYGLSRADARAVEQALIEIHGLQKHGGTLMNRINSIAKTNPIYSQSLKRGNELLTAMGYIF